MLQISPGSDGVPDDLDTRCADHCHAIGGSRAFRSPAQIWGRPSREQAMFVANAALPVMRGVVTARHAFGTFDALLRVRLFGKYKNAKTALLQDIQSFGREAMVDVEAGWTLRDRYRLKLGLQNLFDSYPAQALHETCCGMVYRRDSIVPWQGRLYSLHVGVRFD